MVLAQTAVVRYDYQGHATALFRHGLAILALDALARGSAWPLLPMALVWPRLALEMRGEALGVVHGIL